MNITLTQLQQWLPMAALANASALSPIALNSSIQAIRTDSRSIVAGDLFVALKGETWDGIDFLAQAQAQGAVAVLFEAQVLYATGQRGRPGLASQHAIEGELHLAIEVRRVFDGLNHQYLPA